MRIPVLVAPDGGDGPARGVLVLDGLAAERLHAWLCRTLDGQPPPRDAPECRQEMLGDPRRNTGKNGAGWGW